MQIAVDPHQEKTFLQFKEIIINLEKDKDSAIEFINMFHCWNPQKARSKNMCSFSGHWSDSYVFWLQHFSPGGVLWSLGCYGLVVAPMLKDATFGCFIMWSTWCMFLGGGPEPLGIRYKTTWVVHKRTMDYLGSFVSCMFFVL